MTLRSAVKQGRGIRPLGRHADGIAMTQAKLQQRDQTLGVRCLVAARTWRGPQSGAPSLPSAWRARVQAARVGNGPVKALGQIGGRYLGVVIAMSPVSALTISPALVVRKQALQRCLILDQPGQAAQQGNVGIGLGSDANHQTG